MEFFLKFILLISSLFLPLALFAYLQKLLPSFRYSRLRLLIGVGIGSVLVIAFLLFRHFSHGSDWYFMLFFWLGVSLLALIPLFLRYRKQPVSAFLMRVLFIQTLCLLIVGLLCISVSRFFSVSMLPVTLLALSAFFEESWKHQATLSTSLRSRYFLSHEFFLAGIFVSLGFIIAENILYGISSWAIPLSSYIFLSFGRSFFSTIVHITGVLVLLFGLWRAFDARFLSLQYFAIASSGIIGSFGLHFLYNSLLASGNIALLILLILLMIHMITLILWSALRGYAD